MTSASLTEEQIRRYSRQILLPEVGGRGQKKLLAARVLVIGAGEVAEIAATYLAAAGVGTLGLVAVSDAPRQRTDPCPRRDSTDVPVNEERGGADALPRLAARLAAINPDVRASVREPLGLSQAWAPLLSDLDLVVDAAENVQVAERAHQACIAALRPLVWSSLLVVRVRIGCVLPGRSACGDCLTEAWIHGPWIHGLAEREPRLSALEFAGATPGPQSRPSDRASFSLDAPTQAAAAVLCGSLLAVEALGCLLGTRGGLAGAMLTFDPRTGICERLHADRDLACPTCGAVCAGE